MSTARHAEADIIKDSHIAAEIKQEESILQKAHNLINGPRAKAYGNAFDNWSRTAKIWSVILGIEVTPEQAALCMIGTKLAREVHMKQEDNLLDIAGYIGVHELIVGERESRERGLESIQQFGANKP